MFGLVRQMLEDDIAGAIAGMYLLAFVGGENLLECVQTACLMFFQLTHMQTHKCKLTPCKDPIRRHLSYAILNILLCKV